MSPRHFFSLVSVMIVLMLSASTASAQWGPASRVSPAFQQGHERGLRAGTEDLRRGDRYDFTDEGEYRRADAGYRSQYGHRDRYRDEFRRGYEAGYRSGYGVAGRGGPSWNGRGGPWAGGRAGARIDVARQQGYSDGYEAGLDDGRDNRRFDPVGERRYRSADRGYERHYGDKDYYKANYRTGFRSGYEAGYRDGQRYDRRW
jgi:hypothetical protein